MIHILGLIHFSTVWRFNLYNNWRYSGVRRAAFGVRRSAFGVRHQFCTWLCLNDQAYYCLIHFGGSLGTTRGQLRDSSTEDDIRWKTTYDGRRLMMEDNLWWKTTYDGRRFMVEDDLWWKTSYEGRLLMMEDDLGWKMTYDGRRLIMEHKLW